MNNISPEHGWNRALDKYSPSKNIKLSPTIITQGNLLPFELGQGRTKSMTWLLNANEEYYYQNIIELLSINRQSNATINNLIRKNRLEINWPRTIFEFRRLGQGMFGTVYLATEKVSLQKYAVKQLRLRESNILGKILEVIVERNAHFRANESPFIVKLFGAFQYKRSYWMVFEHCIGDLSMYLSAINNEILTFMDMFLTGNVMDAFNKAYAKQLSLQIEDVAIIYAFELLAGLDYLAGRNLVHKDIKPDNILVSQSGHLKIADLGLSQRLRWIDRYSALTMVTPDDMKMMEEQDIDLDYAGNLAYTDPETLIYYNLIIEQDLVYEVIKSDNFPIEEGEQNFMSDLYGISLIIMELLFVGMNFITTENFSADVIDRFNISLNDVGRILFSIRCLYEEEVHINYLMKILNNQKNDKNYLLIEFLKSAFKPREIRSRKYTKIISHYQFKRLTKSRCIDIEKIEDLDLYYDKNINHFNVCTVTIPEMVINLFKKLSPSVVAVTMGELVEINRVKGETMQDLSMPYFNYTR